MIERGRFGKIGRKVLSAVYFLLSGSIVWYALICQVVNILPIETEWLVCFDS